MLGGCSSGAILWRHGNSTQPLTSICQCWFYWLISRSQPARRRWRSDGPTPAYVSPASTRRSGGRGHLTLASAALIYRWQAETDMPVTFRHSPIRVLLNRFVPAVNPASLPPPCSAPVVHPRPPVAINHRVGRRPPLALDPRTLGTGSYRARDPGPGHQSQSARIPMLVQCRCGVFDAAPTLNQYWDSVSSVGIGFCSRHTSSLIKRILAGLIPGRPQFLPLLLRPRALGSISKFTKHSRWPDYRGRLPGEPRLEPAEPSSCLERRSI